MKIPLEFYEVLRNRINISDVVRQKISLTRKSGEYHGICPFHQEKTPSFTVNDSKKFYHCFGCSAHGDVIKFVSAIDGLSYKDSAIKLANNNGIEIPKLTKEQEQAYEESDQVFNVLSLASEFFQSELNKNSLEYLKSRGIDQKLVEEFEIGYAHSGRLLKFFEKKSIPLMNVAAAGLIGKREDNSTYEVFHNRIMFPIKNVYNKIVGFGGRVLGDSLPKYLNSPETIVFKKSEVLYGENNALTAARRKNYVILVEGYVDVIALHKAGFYETVASLGTAVSEKHLRKLWNACDEIIFCMDGDSAGIRATKKVINGVLPLVANNKKVSFLKLPKDSDPDDVIKNYGPDFFKQLIDNKINLSQMIWDLECDGKLFSTAETKAGLEFRLEEYCDKISDHVLKKNYKQFFKDQIWKNITSNKYNKASAPRPDANRLVTNNHSEIQILEHALCLTILKFPEILKVEEIKSQFQNIHFEMEILTSFRDFIIEQLSLVKDLTNEVVEELVKTTGLFGAFLLPSGSGSSFLDMLSIKTIVPAEIWGFLYKKYYLILLKQEYASIIESGSDDAFKRATTYHQEILKISQELQKLNESLIKL